MNNVEQTKSEVVSTLVEKTGIERTVVENWISYIAAQGRAYLASGCSLVEKANEDMRRLLVDLIEGRTSCGQVARVYLTHYTYASAGGLEYDPSQGSLEEYAVLSTINDPKLDAVRDDNEIYRIARELGGMS